MMPNNDRREKWLCREVDADGKPCLLTFTINYVTPRTIEAAAEAAASELDDKEYGDFDSWEIGQINGNRRTIEVEESPGVWVRFAVVLRITTVYEATITKGK